MNEYITPTKNAVYKCSSMGSTGGAFEIAVGTFPLDDCWAKHIILCYDAVAAEQVRDFVTSCRAYGASCDRFGSAFLLPLSEVRQIKLF